MERRIHGVLTLALMGLAFLIGLLVTAHFSFGWALFYAALLFVCPPVTVYAYCTKCPARENDCAHVAPGLMTRFLPPREPGPYNGADYLGMALPLGILLMVPVPFLARVPFWFVIYGLLLAVAVADIFLNVCRGCPNENCGVCKLRNPGGSC